MKTNTKTNNNKINLERVWRDTILLNYKKEKIKMSMKEYQEVIKETKSLIKDFNEEMLINWEE